MDHEYADASTEIDLDAVRTDIKVAANLIAEKYSEATIRSKIDFGQVNSEVGSDLLLLDQSPKKHDIDEGQTVTFEPLDFSLYGKVKGSIQKRLQGQPKTRWHDLLKGQMATITQLIDHEINPTTSPADGTTQLELDDTDVLKTDLVRAISQHPSATDEEKFRTLTYLGRVFELDGRGSSTPVTNIKNRPSTH